MSIINTLRIQLHLIASVLSLIVIIAVTLFLSACMGTGPGYYGGDRDPAWSPDGTKIAFSSYNYNRIGCREICVMNADGSNQTALKPNAWGATPAWCPDGTKLAFSYGITGIVFSAGRGEHGEIYTMNADGSNLTNLTNNPASDYCPTWSPDGTRIAFGSERDGNWEIYVMNADGSNLTNLTNNPASDYSPAWSPDGTRIAFVSDRNGHKEIHIMNTDGSNQADLLSMPPVEFARMVSPDGSTKILVKDEEEPVWSPDGKRIAFLLGNENAGDIYIANADGANYRTLSSYAPIPISHITWSPDGAKIAFAGARTTWRGMAVEIYVMDSDSGNRSRLTLTPGIDSILSLPQTWYILLGVLGVTVVVVILIIRLIKRHRRVS